MQTKKQALLRPDRIQCCYVIASTAPMCNGQSDVTHHGHQQPPDAKSTMVAFLSASVGP
jgi:hypothetical protein